MPLIGTIAAGGVSSSSNIFSADLYTDLTEDVSGFTPTFTRASTQYTALSGSLTSYGTDVAAYGDTGLSAQMTSTNYITYSDDLTNAAWSTTNLTAASGSPTTILGRSTTKLTDSGSGGGYVEFGSIGHKGFTVFSVWLSCASGTVGVDLEVYGSANSDTKTVTVTTTPTRFWISMTTAAWTGSTFTARIKVNDASGEVFATLAQYESQLNLTDEIPTSGSTATRASGLMTWAVSGFPVNDISGSFTYKCHGGQQFTYFMPLYCDSSNYFRVGIAPGTISVRKRVGGSNKAGTNATMSLVDGQEYLVEWEVSSTTGVSVTVDGKSATHADTADFGSAVTKVAPQSGQSNVTSTIYGAGQVKEMVIS